jgi:hypothetical protein
MRFLPVRTVTLSTGAAQIVVPIRIKRTHSALVLRQTMLSCTVVMTTGRTGTRFEQEAGDASSLTASHRTAARKRCGLVFDSGIRERVSGHSHANAEDSSLLCEIPALFAGLPAMSVRFAQMVCCVSHAGRGGGATGASARGYTPGVRA